MLRRFPIVVRVAYRTPSSPPDRFSAVPASAMYRPAPPGIGEFAACACQVARHLGDLLNANGERPGTRRRGSRRSARQPTVSAAACETFRCVGVARTSVWRRAGVNFRRNRVVDMGARPRVDAPDGADARPRRLRRRTRQLVARRLAVLQRVARGIALPNPVVPAVDGRPPRRDRAVGRTDGRAGPARLPIRHLRLAHGSCRSWRWRSSAR